MAWEPGRALYWCVSRWDSAWKVNSEARDSSGGILALLTVAVSGGSRILSEEFGECYLLCCILIEAA